MCLFVEHDKTIKSTSSQILLLVHIIVDSNIRIIVISNTVTGFYSQGLINVVNTDIIRLLEDDR